jgi:hypothetical protein
VLKKLRELRTDSLTLLLNLFHLFSFYIFYLPTPGFFVRNGWEVPPTRKRKIHMDSLKAFSFRTSTVVYNS